MAMKPTKVPALVMFTNGFVTWLGRLGVPLGPNTLLTVRGRKSGVPRTTPVAIVKVGERRWVQSPFGEVQWVRNLRAAGEATLTTGSHTEAVTATPLSREEATAFYCDTLRASIDQSLFTRLVGRILGLTALIADPEHAAATHAVFELHPPR